MITWAERAKAAISQRGRGGTAGTDETSFSGILAVSSVTTDAVPAFPEVLSSVLTVPSPALLEKHDSSIVVSKNPDRWCWPQSSAMNGTEIDMFAARLHRFTDKGLSQTDGEALADKLVLRDRDQDERRVCLECKNFAGHGAGSWRCRNWQATGIAIRSRDAQLPADLVVQLRRCGGFTAQLTST